MSGRAELPWGDSLLRLERFSLGSGDLPVDQYTEVFPAYLKVSMQSPTGNTELGDTPWRRFRDHLLRWLRSDPVKPVGDDGTWTALVHFEPLQYSIYGSVQRPPWRLHLQDARADPVTVIVERDMSLDEVEAWIASISSVECGPTRG